MEWKPRSPEDRLLQAYCQRVGGRVYVEVPIGGPGGRGNWPPGCTIRRIDGVRFPSATGQSGIWWFGTQATEFNEDLAGGGPVEIIEIKSRLNRTAIGQAIAGVDMFDRQYGRAGGGVILCAEGDSALEWVCAKRSIIVVKVDSASVEGEIKRGVTADRGRHSGFPRGSASPSGPGG
jgi:hypothetical protein